VIDYLPSPKDIGFVEGIKDGAEEMVQIPNTPEEPFSALAFKIATDPFVGQLVFARIYTGTLSAGATILNSSKNQKERIGRMLLMHSNTREEIKEAKAGDIVALVGLKNVTTGNTICDPSNVVVLEKMEFPEPVIEVAVEPKTKADYEKMGQALNRLAQEDPSFRVATDEESGQTLIKGMGELHLEILVDRMKREFKVEADVGAPQVAYRETMTKEVDVDYTHKKQSGGAGQFARVKIKFKPTERMSGFKFTNTVVGGNIPREYIPGVEKGIKQACQNGVIAGYNVIDFEAEVYDGAFHDVDSSVLAFEIASRAAFRDAMKKANPKLLEPVMKVEVVTAEEYMGDIIGDLNSRRGQIEKMEDRGNAKVISSTVPLANMFGYVNNLRSMSQGRASYTMLFSHYEVVPSNVEEEIKSKLA
jgi:elongation factor G